MLQWPPDLQSSYLRDDDWGITWTELYVNFLMVTGFYFPIKLKDSGPYARYVPFHSDEALLAPKSKKPLASQVLMFQRSLQALSSLTEIQWFPSFDSGKVCSLRHAGWGVQANGIPCRPIMPRRNESMLVIKKMIKGPAFHKTLNETFVNESIDPLIPFPGVPELPDDARFKSYLAFMNRRRYVRRQDA